MVALCGAVLFNGVPLNDSVTQGFLMWVGSLMQVIAPVSHEQFNGAVITVYIAAALSLNTV